MPTDLLTFITFVFDEGIGTSIFFIVPSLPVVCGFKLFPIKDMTAISVLILHVAVAFPEKTGRLKCSFPSFISGNVFAPLTDPALRDAAIRPKRFLPVELSE